MANKEEIKKEAEEIFDRGTGPTPAEIMKMAKKSGKSFRQIMVETKLQKKNMEKARAQAEAEGKEFSEAVYLRSQMNKPQKRVVVKRK